jgi:hypothetical protein
VLCQFSVLQGGAALLTGALLFLSLDNHFVLSSAQSPFSRHQVSSVGHLAASRARSGSWP